MRLPVLMFDFGNVIGHFDYSTMYEKFGAMLGISPQQFETMVYARGAAQLGREFERGFISAEEFARQITAIAGLEISFQEFERVWPDIFTLNEPVARLVAGLKRNGYTLLLGSNTNVLHATHYRRQFAEALAPFDHFVFSYEIGEMKPEPGFFKACLDAVGAPASSCVFIDDAAANVAGARAAGLLGVHYRSPACLAHDLRRLNVEVPDF
jgi:putative hydrolase of the HAD superfamily